MWHISQNGRYKRLLEHLNLEEHFDLVRKWGKSPRMSFQGKHRVESNKRVWIPPVHIFHRCKRPGLPWPTVGPSWIGFVQMQVLLPWYRTSVTSTWMLLPDPNIFSFTCISFNPDQCHLSQYYCKSRGCREPTAYQLILKNQYKLVCITLFQTQCSINLQPMIKEGRN